MHITYEVFCRIQEMKSLGMWQWQVADELGCAVSTVKRYWRLSADEFLALPRRQGQSVVGRYRQQIVDMLEEDGCLSNKEILARLASVNADFTLKPRVVLEYLYKLRREEGFTYADGGRHYQVRVETTPGEESQVDMGQIVVHGIYGHRVKIYMFAMVLACSRMLFVTFRTEPFDSNAFVDAHKRAFLYFGGRTETLMYDQDRVMVVSENAGNIIFTQQFEEFKSQTGFNVYLCHKSDPNTKGKIERMIGYIKFNFFKGYKFTNISTLNADGLNWLDNVANKRIHGATLKVPTEEYISKEKATLIPFEMQERIEIKYRIAKVTHLNTIRYMTNNYSVPIGRYSLGDSVKIARVGDHLKIYDVDSDELIVQHLVLQTRGSSSIMPEKRWQYDDIIANTLEILRNTDFAIVLLEKIKQNMPRYVREQCNMLKRIAKNYTSAEVDSAIQKSIQQNIYDATNVLAILVSESGIEKAEQGKVLPIRTKEHYKRKASELKKYDALMRKDGGNENA